MLVADSWLAAAGRYSWGPMPFQFQFQLKWLIFWKLIICIYLGKWDSLVELVDLVSYESGWFHTILKSQEFMKANFERVF